MDAFASELEKAKDKIASVESKTFKYGPHERHEVCSVSSTGADKHKLTVFKQKLEVYYPPPSSSSKPPILVFHYGGGFYSGGKRFPVPREFVYANLGAFFAQRGFLVVIPDYRLVPEIVYPNPAEDSAAALKWIVENLADSGDTENLVIMAHSAGAAIVSTVLLHEPSLIEDGLRKRIKGAVLVGGPYHHDGPPSAPPDVVAHYYGTAEEKAVKLPIALLRKASEERLASLPKLLLLVSEKDAEGITLAHKDFSQLAKERLGAKVETGVAKRHNHISLNWAVGTGDGEEWAEEVAKWAKAVVSS